jgi:tetratricopeptide (TPR) repeat protein
MAATSKIMTEEDYEKKEEQQGEFMNVLEHVEHLKQQAT